jgi:hypothetical protein
MNKMRVNEAFLPIYTEYPETQASFLEIYQLLAQRVPWQHVADSCFQLFVSSEPTIEAALADIRSVHPDIYRAFFLLAEGEDKGKARLALRWLRGETLARTDLRDAGLSQALSTPPECAATISVLAKLLGLKASQDKAKHPFRLVWIVDECQRLGSAAARLNQEVNAGLQSTFNATPDYLSLILSFSGVPEQQIPRWLRPELADRIGMRNLILLPPLDRKAAKEFLRELLDHFRTSGPANAPFFPFTESAIDYMIARVIHGKLALIDGFTEDEGVRPRALMKIAQAVLEEHLESGAKVPIEERFVAQMFPKEAK